MAAEIEKHYRELLEGTEDLITCVDSKGNFTYVNHVAEKIFGIKPKECISRSAFDFIHPEDRERTKEEFKKWAEQKVKHVYYQNRQVSRTGQIFDMSWSINLNFDASGNVVSIWNIARDITEHKLMEKKMRESEQKYRELVENANSIILHWTPEGKVIFLNEFGQRFFGYSEDEIYTRHVIGTIVPETETGGRDLRMMIDKICADPVVFEQNINENMRRNGERVWIAWTNKVMMDQQGKVKNILSIGTDITERRLAETKLKESLKEKEFLLHELNHRVNNNLQLIANLASLQRKFITDQKAAVLFDETQNRIRSIALVHEKLYLTKGFSDINFSEYLGELTNSIFKSLPPAGHKLSLKVDVEDVRLDIERSVTCGLIINEILSNAFKYAFPGNRKGEVFVSLHKVGKGGIELIIEDNGVGMPPNIDPHTVESLGMKLIYNLAEKQLDGNIVLDRSSGTRFKITFKEEPVNHPDKGASHER